jgi:hypothetical protein
MPSISLCGLISEVFPQSPNYLVTNLDKSATSNSEQKGIIKMSFPKHVSVEKIIFEVPTSRATCLRQY